MSEPVVVAQPKTRSAVLVPVVSSFRGTAGASDEKIDSDPTTELLRSPDAQLAEASGLAAAIDLDIVLTDISRVAVLKPSTLYGGGKVEELGALLKERHVDVAIVDHPLTPVQQRNLERAWQVKVLDRTGIILEIFGARAQTKEGRLQVELAALRYQRGRLVRSWTHLERQRGGAGFLGGPGETQIEADRRALQTKIERLEKQLEQVRRTRSLHRKQRKKQEIPIIAFVGYTNAGKSTLFNRITKADVFAKDLLFATLDPTLRRVELPQGTTVILSDTVGFISNLPTDLIAAFRATLEEVIEADIIIHVRDISHEDTKAQAEDVRAVLEDLGVDIDNLDVADDRARSHVEVWNKVDLLERSEVDFLTNQAEHRIDDDIHLASAMTGQGIEELLEHIETLLNRGQQVRTISLEGDALSNLHLAYTLGTVLARHEREDGIIDLTIRSAQWNELNKNFRA